MALSFCPPSISSSNASNIIASTKALLPTRTLLPISKPQAAPTDHPSAPAGPSAAPSHQPTLGSFPPPAPKKNYKRVVHPTVTVVDGAPAVKKRKLVAGGSSASSSRASPASHRPSPAARAPPPPRHEYSDDDEPEIDYRTFGTRNRSSTPRENSKPFGQYEDRTQARIRKMPPLIYKDHLGIKDDGRVDGLITSEIVVRPILHRYKKYFRNLDDPADTSFNPHPTAYPVVQLEYPNYEASERFILLSPLDPDHYHPIIELMEAIYTIVSSYLVPGHQAIFGTLPPKYEAFNAYVPLDEFSPPGSPVSAPLSPLNPLHNQTVSSLSTSESSAYKMSGQDPLRNMEKAYHTANGPLFIQSINLINELIKKLRDRMVHAIRFGWRGVPPQITKVLLEESYQRTVGPSVKELGKYPPFSDLVYGELNAPFISDILFRTEISASSMFVDLGCGVGNCLIQAAMQTGCTANGIELNAPPAALGKLQVEQYKKRLKLWGVRSGDVNILEGNFCESSDVRDWLSCADLVLVNNWAFSSSLNEKLSLMFLDLKEGARIASLKPFRRSDFRLTERTASSPEAIFRVEEIPFRRGTVSWMAEGGVYYLHTVDREPLRLYFEKEMQQVNGISEQHHGHGAVKEPATRRKRAGVSAVVKEREREGEGWS
ncbi:Nucleosomal histone H3-Lys79 methylase [Tulasnella sp. 330]|nr:Nucleosomal histone H3-Lys79 methylase [Tulasnella sp. 330]KAG8882789.1 Nucleosomal histone H3-Lys79 methylase [Tulasnella sp. 331]KAG8889498.1 Nucleosomal histone H3-Lys79 methylase [Tulasnella sp. 332]